MRFVQLILSGIFPFPLEITVEVKTWTGQNYHLFCLSLVPSFSITSLLNESAETVGDFFTLSSVPTDFDGRMLVGRRVGLRGQRKIQTKPYQMQCL